MAKKRRIAEKLFETATAQQGYFTYRQALKAGYRPSSTIYHVKTGNWMKEKVRGIYRLAQFPPQDRPDLVLWSLWSADRKGRIQGVYSHETALSLYELTDVMPAKFHLTVSRKFRKSGSLPSHIKLHRAELKDGEIREMQGYSVTTPAKTIADMFEARTMHPAEITAAFKQAVKAGLITQKEARLVRLPRKDNDE